MITMLGVSGVRVRYFFNGRIKPEKGRKLKTSVCYEVAQVLVLK